MNRWCTLWMGVICLGCGSGLPTRYVIEHDVGGFAYRRYQKTLGVELVIEGNQGVGHTATYLQRRAGGQVAVATAFVTVYEHARALSAEARERLQHLDGYRFSVVELQGEQVWKLDGGPSEHWLIWVSGRSLVKLGPPEGEPLPDAFAEAYLELYPSDLDEHGRARADTASAGKPRSAKTQSTAPKVEPEIPRHLRDRAPR